MKTALSIRNVTMQFGGVMAVNRFSMEVGKGEIIAVIGPNGAGKTTTFNMITGVYRPTKGRILYTKGAKRIDIAGKRPDEITKLGIARTFQNIRLFKELSVLDNVLIGNHLHLKSNFAEAMLKLPNYKRQEAQQYEKSIALLKKVQLEPYLQYKSASLPYGMQRKLEIARALATEPDILLLDEPAAGMNPTETEELTMFIKKIRSEFGLSILLIEHHMQVVMGISDRIYVLDYGNLIAEGPPTEIQNNPKVIEAYLGVDEDA